MNLTPETTALMQKRYSEVRTNIIFDMHGILDGFQARFPLEMQTPRDIQSMIELHHALVSLSYGLPVPDGEGA